MTITMTNTRSLIAAAVLAGMSAFAGAQTTAPLPIKDATTTAVPMTAQADPVSGARQHAATAKNKSVKKVVAKKQPSKKKPQKVKVAKKHAATGANKA